MSTFPSPSVLHTVTLPPDVLPRNLAPIPPDIQLEGQLKLSMEPDGSLFGPPSAFNVAMKAAPRPPCRLPEMTAIDPGRPSLQLWTPLPSRELMPDQEWLTLMSTQRHIIQSFAPRSLGRTANSLPTEPHATGSVRSRSPQHVHAGGEENDLIHHAYTSR
ncbi:hypothetical protein SISNIDRAFT_458046 [Sistotremastrum niveocremeum HHB9708]|uniref:Uncharacterized protein n=1 Tax=Sistotremastrum niveocremeum HHB9708 TaxID=1314777 RepID=A0A164R0E4_9AGAM|nr:hypothetical protein SISNIDRAFT_458046 [Sistotremastrum niveocremeum HHB9708]